MTSTPNQPGQAPSDPATDPVTPETAPPNPETGPDGLPEPDPEVREGDDTQPGQMPEHDTDVGA
jgi:hypothetical protein